MIQLLIREQQALEPHGDLEKRSHPQFPRGYRLNMQVEGLVVGGRIASLKLHNNNIRAMRDEVIGEANKPKPLTLRRRTNTNGHCKVSAHFRISTKAYAVIDI